MGLGYYSPARNQQPALAISLSHARLWDRCHLGHLRPCTDPIVCTCSVLEVVGSNSAAFPRAGPEHRRFLTRAGKPWRTFIPQRCPEQVNPHPIQAGHLVPGESGRVVWTSLMGADKNCGHQGGKSNPQTYKPLQQGNSSLTP